jgi:transcriptional regulator
MYLPSQFEETRVEVLHRLIAEYPLGMLVTLTTDGLNANHMPFLIDPDPAPFGTLRAHVARANPVWRDFSRDVESLVVFQGPHAYITPSWYQTKRETGMVVPTYNYAVVHARGPLTAIEDPEWLRTFVRRLTDRFEAQRKEPWNVSDAPSEFVEKMLRSIVGFEMPVSKLMGKWKVSQNRPAVDRAGVIAGLRESGDHDALAMADEVEQRMTKLKS